MRKAEVLALLRESGGYLSGQELCGRLGVSRTAVWKIINQLKEEGYGIEAAPNRGYRLLASPDLLGEGEIASRLRTKWAGRNLIFRQTTGSTNTDAKAEAEKGAPEGTLVVSERQETGRGRRGRQWFSPEGSNLYFTLLLRPACAPGGNVCALSTPFLNYTETRFPFPRCPKQTHEGRTRRGRVYARAGEKR